MKKFNYEIKLNTNATQYPEKLAGALEILGEKIIEDANKTVPFDTGDLMRSGQAKPTTDPLEVEIIYDRPYAVIHETAKEGTFNYQSPEARSGWVRKTIRENENKYAEWLTKQAIRLLGR